MDYSDLIKLQRCGRICAVCIAILFPVSAPAQFSFLRSLTIPGLGRTTVDRTSLQRAQALESVGDIQGAIRAAEAQVEADKQLGGFASAIGPNPYLQQSARYAAHLNLEGGKPRRAIELYKLVLDKSSMMARMPGGVRIFMPIKMALASAYEAAGEDAEARRIYAELMPQIRALGPAGLVEAVTVLGHWGELEMRAGNQDEAERMLREGVQAQIDLAGGAQGGGAGGTSMFDAINPLRNALNAAAQMAGAMPSVSVADTSGQLVQGAGASAAQYRRDNLIGPLSALAELYFTEGNAEKLKALYDGEFAQWKNLTGNSAGQGAAQPGYGALRGNVQLEWEEAWFGGYFAKLGMTAEAEAAFDAAFKLNSERLQGFACGVSPELMAPLFESRRRILGLYLDAFLQARAKPQDWEQKAVGRIFDTKGMVSEFIAKRNRAIEQSGGAEAGKLMDELRRIELDATQAPSTDVNAEMMRRVQLANRRIETINKLQALVGARLPGIVLDDGSQLLREVRARLKGETLVGFVQYTPFDLRNKKPLPARYAAYSVNAAGATSIVDIGDEDNIDTLVQRLRAAIGPQQGNPPGAGDFLAVASQLYQRIFSPLLSDPLSITEIAVDPDGMLNLVPFAALADSSGKFLIEKATIRNIVSPRALAGATPPAAASGAALVMAAPDYGEALPGSHGGALAQLRGADGIAMGQEHFAPLPETLDEGRAVAKILSAKMGVKTTLLSGADASAAALAAHASPRYLHLATHGFYLEDPIIAYSAAGAKARGRTIALEYSDLSAGLALAGANQALASTGYQGIYFASQLELLNLSGTDLAVLSACDTGNGAIDVGEGVASLSRALEYAGARSTITSLWSVPSAQTRDLMVAFYQGLAAGQGKAEALRQAKLTVMASSPDPFYWAGFVLSGDR